MQIDAVKELIQDIIRHELNLEKMYQQFAKSHPNHRQFWSQLAREEAMHAKWITSLARHYKNGHIRSSDFKLNHQVVKTSISHLEKQTEASKNGKLSLLNAASIALDVEKSMIEKKFFEIFDLTDSRHERIRAGLEKATTKHRQKLEKLFSELSKN
jgi:rubrerythrin